MLTLENSDSKLFFLQKGVDPSFSSFFLARISSLGPLTSDRPVRFFKVTLTLWFLRLAFWFLKLPFWLFMAFQPKHRAYKEFVETKEGIVALQGEQKKIYLYAAYRAV